MSKAKPGFQFPAEQEDTVDLAFDADHSLHGLVITVRKNVPTSLLLAAADEDVAEMVRGFVAEIRDWNVVDAAGEAVPFSLKEFGRRVPIEQVRPILDAWTEVLTKAGGPFGGSSSGGG